ncbi:hypothetical protein I7I53_09658 [Histoplasma capsulatum var. duboisii H88]|uniref:Uncharacterized protein n=1 Tax=Ajellomyces capsulatus (strain H88) TaxID=544711 RepID=A0A8A1L5V9_AJEC8|nr:hypothetical protein I7I53_09658 [Histoplasma capsulatum var. duboisii H88]
MFKALPLRLGHQSTSIFCIEGNHLKAIDQDRYYDISKFVPKQASQYPSLQLIRLSTLPCFHCGFTQSICAIIRKWSIPVATICI